MRKLIFLSICIAFSLFVSQANAQTETNPSLNLPLLDETETATVVPTQAPITSFATVTAAPTYAPTQSVIDDAETGTEIYYLIFFSIIAGIGLFFIKKYFDLKKYSL